MCGIVGAVGLTARPDPEHERSVLGEIFHRGPDSSGAFYSDGVWLGVRRLKILDLREQADQPFIDPESGVVIAYNGEIYNYVELRTELEAAGHRFLTTGDTEVLLKGYVEWGEDVFARCNGMWAVALYDPRRKRLLLCRDRFGEKPLFVGRAADGAWWFGSEPSALRRAGAGTGRPDRARVLNFLAFGDAEDPEGSFFEGIRQLQPGAFAELGPDGLGATRRWWDLEQFVGRRWGEDRPSDGEILDRLDASVRLRLRSDVSVGSSLSGGVDSSSVLASIRNVDTARDIHVFTASFPGRGIDEWPRAERVARMFGATAHRVEPTAAGFVDELDALVERQGGPIESPSVYAQWCVMRRAAEEGVVVLLDGQGADETWGGYLKYVWFAVGDALLARQPSGAARIVRTWRSSGSLPRPDVPQVVALRLPPRLRRPARRAFVRGLRGSLGPALRDAYGSDPQGRSTRGPLLARVAVSDSERVILPRLLRYADRNSMAWSRELRLPFLDPELVAAAVASGWRDGLESGWTKARLRSAAEKRLPSEVVWTREKTAYEVPDREWLSHPDISSAVVDAAHSLHRHGLLARAHPGSLPPWRVLSLGRFVESARLTV
jgi:asparagine synthase (glutamine-hydrolysing)